VIGPDLGRGTQCSAAVLRAERSVLV